LGFFREVSIFHYFLRFLKSSVVLVKKNNTT